MTILFYISTCSKVFNYHRLERYILDFNTICVASLQKGPDVAKKTKIEIFVDHNRADHD